MLSSLKCFQKLLNTRTYVRITDRFCWYFDPLLVRHLSWSCVCRCHLAKIQVTHTGTEALEVTFFWTGTRDRKPESAPFLITVWPPTNRGFAELANFETWTLLLFLFAQRKKKLPPKIGWIKIIRNTRQVAKRMNKCEFLLEVQNFCNVARGQIRGNISCTFWFYKEYSLTNFKWKAEE